MAVNKRISELSSLSVATADDLFAIVEMSGSPNETMHITKGNLMNSPGPIGGINPSTGDFSALTLVNQINEFSTDDTLSGDSDTAVPTERAVKTYVDSEVEKATNDVVRMQVVPVSSDTTAVGGNIILGDTTGGNVQVDLVPDTDGRILILKTAEDNKITIVSSTGILYDGEEVISIDLEVWNASIEILCVDDNFYVI